MTILKLFITLIAFSSKLDLLELQSNHAELMNAISTCQDSNEKLTKEITEASNSLKKKQLVLSSVERCNIVLFNRVSKVQDNNEKVTNEIKEAGNFLCSDCTEVYNKLNIVVNDDATLTPDY